MTPAYVWTEAYFKEWRASRDFCSQEGYDLNQMMANGETVRTFCHRRAEEFAEEMRAKFVAKNPTWLEELHGVSK